MQRSGNAPSKSNGRGRKGRWPSAPAIAGTSRAIVVLLLALGGCATTPPAAPPLQQPEIATGWQDKPGWSAAHRMVAAANPLATAAGERILREGGSALDAAIAVQMVLNLVEPQSSGIGGGAFLMLADQGRIEAWDGRETAPADADARLFIGADGRPLAHGLAILGGRAVATPGVLKMLEAAHRVHGRLPWSQLFAPAIELAEAGFAVSPRLHALIAADKHLRDDPQARAYFYDTAGAPWPVGHRLDNPALAAVLRAVAAGGSDAFYRGAIAADLIARVQAGAAPGRLSLADLAGYRERRREPLCADWREHERVCGFPPPSSGQIAIMQILGMLEHLGTTATGPGLADGLPAPAWLHDDTEAMRLAFADRELYIADPDFVAAPGGDWRKLLAPAYLARRAALIGPRAMSKASAGEPAGGAAIWAPMPAQAEHGTSQISIVDGHGQALAMTTSIEAGFGAHVMADGGTGLRGGYLLDNTMTDFSFEPADAGGRLVANRIEPGKRPRSSMSPTLVFDRRDGRLLMALGSPGGPAIIAFVVQTLIGSFVWGLDVQRAIALPHAVVVDRSPLLLESGRYPAATLAALRALGHRVVEVPLPSGLQAIERRGDGWFGGADPRREGTVEGD
ncbi:MAG: gamma-glutamyltransferase family protein [Burkholderiales bacterium]|nr:gamma-glutamyltransferase family protein [Burkholderiales bacterium]